MVVADQAEEIKQEEIHSSKIAHIMGIYK